MLRFISLTLIIMLFVGALCFGPAAAEDLYPDVTRISAEVAYFKYKSGNVILIDAMSPEVYADKHILGAINIPNRHVEDRERLRETDFDFPVDKEIIIYCM